MALADGRTAAINTINAILDASEGKEKATAQLDMATAIVDAVIALIATGVVSTTVSTVVTTPDTFTGTGAGTGAGVMT